MSIVAVRIQYNVAASPPPYTWATLDFYDYEIVNAGVSPGRSSIRKVLGNGSPKLIHRTGFGVVDIGFKLSNYSGVLSTIEKLQTIDTYSGYDSNLVIFTKYQIDPNFNRICVIEKGQIPDMIGTAGYHQHGAELTVQFLEVQRAAGKAIDLGDLST